MQCYAIDQRSVFHDACYAQTFNDNCSDLVPVRCEAQPLRKHFINGFWLIGCIFLLNAQTTSLNFAGSFRLSLDRYQNVKVPKMPAPHPSLGTDDLSEPWLEDAMHRTWLESDAARQLDFFRASLRKDGGFNTLAYDGSGLPYAFQELHTTTRLVHSYALGKALGAEGCEDIVDAGIGFLWKSHCDQQHGGYAWSARPGVLEDGVKLAYGHMFVLLAASSAKLVGHPDADRMLDDVSGILEEKYWEDSIGLFSDEYNRDWTPFSNYRGMNANMHGVEAHLAAYEATNETVYLDRAGRVLDFFVNHIAASNKWAISEHYTSNWKIDADYEGNPMFRPNGSTPGHSFELGRLVIQHWDLSGRADSEAPVRARKLIETALKSAWRENRGFAYTLDARGNILRPDRYWWPVCEAIGALSALLKIGGTQEDEIWYRRCWHTASDLFIDAKNGGWFPEIDENDQPDATQFAGKPDIYHALQADVIPLANGVSNLFGDLGNMRQ